MSSKGSIPGATNKTSTGTGRPPSSQENLSTNRPPRLVESAFSASSPGPDTASTESTRTVRGFSAMLPTPGMASASTPSYPFPQMSLGSGTPQPTTPALHKPFTALSPTVTPAANHFSRAQLSKGPLAPNLTTPTTSRAAAQNATPIEHQIFQQNGPDLDEIALKLHLEPGLEKWWANTAQILHDAFGADRATLAVPSDNTDLENVPWAQMATYSATDDDIYSAATKDLQSTISGLTNSSGRDDAKSEASHGGYSVTAELGGKIWADSGAPSKRPPMQSWHSFAGFANQGSRDLKDVPETLTSSLRPEILRTSSTMSIQDALSEAYGVSKGVRLSSQSLKLLASQAGKSSEATDVHAPVAACRARVLPVLQTLEMESDPLLDSAGAVRVLQRGKVVQLTREYLDAAISYHEGLNKDKAKLVDGKALWPVHDGPLAINKGGMPNLSGLSSVRPPLSRTQTTESGKSSSAPSSGKEGSRKQTSRVTAYEDYEQVSASPWSQSPAPSPAIHTDPDINPFFTDVAVDEEAFSDHPPPHDYAADIPVEAIGIDKADSVIHIPLMHPLLSMPKVEPRLRNAIGKQIRNLNSKAQPSYAQHRTSGQYQPGNQPGTQFTGKMIPIAIISFLSTNVPHPVEFLSAIESLVPHLATSFHNARQFSSLEKQLAGISRRRYGPNQDLGAQGSYHPENIATSTGLAYINTGPEYFSPPGTESTVSASDYSGQSLHSPRPSLSGTPVWETPGYTFPDDRIIYDTRESLPDPGDGYFGPRKRYSPGRVGSGTVPTTGILSITSPVISTGKEPMRGPSSSANKMPNISEESHVSSKDPVAGRKVKQDIILERTGSTSKSNRQSGGQDQGSYGGAKAEESSTRDSSPSGRSADTQGSPRRQAISHSQHKQLQTHGADFMATNPSLPAAATRKGTMSVSPDKRRSPREEDFTFEPPTSGMMRIMIDTGAVQEFIAEPVTGNITWANSRFQTYRNDSAAQIQRNPWDTIYHKDKRTFRKLWANALKLGDQVSHQVRLRRFDGQYRWFHVRIVPIKDNYSTIQHWHGQAMDIHDQHVAEVDAAKEKEKAKGERKFRILANGNPQIIFAASGTDGMVFANSQWLSYSGQVMDEALGFGFLEHVHPEDVFKCQFINPNATPSQAASPSGSPVSSLGGRATVADSLSSTGGSDSTAVPQKNREEDPLDSIDDVAGTTQIRVSAATLRKLEDAGAIRTFKDSQGHLCISAEMRLKSKCGTYRWHIVRGSLIEPVNFGPGEAQWSIACMDITDLKYAFAKLRKETKQKMHFLSIMSHEIRTPLNGILGYVQFLLNSKLTEDQLEWMYGIGGAARTLHDLINTILDVNKAEANMLKLYYEWFPIRSIIDEVIETLSSKANEKRLELCYEIDPLVPGSVKGDKTRIRQILMNLVGNAIKFTQSGDVLVACSVAKGPVQSSPRTRNSPSDITLEFKVEDTGSGFTDEDAKVLFQPYSQLDNDNTRNNGGTGLGLLLCKQMAELHGGKISAESRPGKGSTFRFTALFKLPTAEDRPELRAAQSSGEISTISSLGGRKYLLGQGWVDSPGTLATDSPVLESSGSSDPSVRSARSISLRQSLRSSASSFDNELSMTPVRLKLIPKDGSGEDPVRRASKTEPSPLHQQNPETFRPPMFSILLVCPQENTRRTTENHIQQVLPKAIPAKITVSGEVEDSLNMVNGQNPLNFTHVVLQLFEATQVLKFMELFLKPNEQSLGCILVITDQAQKLSITAGAPDLDYEKLSIDGRLKFLLKPATPEKLARIFDPNQENALSVNQNRENTRETAAIRNQAFKLFKQVLGKSGNRVLAVEDNVVNMRVSLYWRYSNKTNILAHFRCSKRSFTERAGWKLMRQRMVWNALRWCSLMTHFITLLSW